MQFAWRALLASTAVYVGLTAAMGHQVLAALGSAIASDPGDPVLTAAILEWNARQVPLTDAWWQFPSFFPVRDTMAFTEHLLGLSVIATPLAWLTGDPLVTYNLTLLLTFPLSALAMFALALRLTGSPAAAFLAGLAFGFAPYRISHLPHIHVLAIFWAPLALLGLHAFLDTGRRRWLILFGVAWALQGAANAYLMVLLSLLVGAWILWFLILRRRWRETAWAGAALFVALMPLLPIVIRYLTVHAEHGFSRSLGEVAYFGADIAGVLCASDRLAFWDWLRVGCRPEGELFAGLGVMVLCGAGVLLWARGPRPGAPLPSDAGAARVDDTGAAKADDTGAAKADGTGAAGTDDRGSHAIGASRVMADPPPLRFIRRLLLGGAAVYAVVLASVLIAGPWEVHLGPFRASASSARKPLSTFILLLIVAGALSPWVRRAVVDACGVGMRHGSAAWFYAGAALVAWVLSWGPFPKLLGTEVLYMAPYRWLMPLPGFDGLRVPARLWMIVMICLAVLVALAAERWLRGRSWRARAAIVGVLGIILAADGWAVLPMAAPPAAVPAAAALQGRVVLEMPIGDLVTDVAAQYRAVTGGWTSVNGYSGYAPAHYLALRTAAAHEDDALFALFLPAGDLDVLVPPDAAGADAFVRRQPGAALVARNAQFAHYRLPRQGEPLVPLQPAGTRADIAALDGTCEADALHYAFDGQPGTAWHCPFQTEDHHVVIDLEAPQEVGAVVHALGVSHMNFPRRLVIDTSEDMESWTAAWDGSVPAVVLAAAMEDQRNPRPVFAFEPRRARYVRLRQVGRDTYWWSIHELEVWSGAVASRP